MIFKTFIFILLTSLTFLPCKASCERATGIFKDSSISTSTIALPANIIIEARRYYPEEVIYNSDWILGSNPSLTITNCGWNYVVGYFYLNAPQINNVSRVMPTNLNGIGIIVAAMNQAGPNDDPKAIDNGWHSGSVQWEDHTLVNSQYKIALVATGEPIESGTLTFGSPLAHVEFREHSSQSAPGDVASEVRLTNTNVVIKAMGCEADVSDITFNFGSVNVSEFNDKSKAGFAPKKKVTLHCEPGTNVDLTVTAPEAAGDNLNHNVIALANEGSENVASGIGVQLGLKTSHYDSGEEGLPLNQTINLFDSSRNDHLYVSGGTSREESLIFSATYYKTSGVITPGTANATAVLTLTYN